MNKFITAKNHFLNLIGHFGASNLHGGSSRSEHDADIIQTGAVSCFHLAQTLGELGKAMPSKTKRDFIRNFSESFYGFKNDIYAAFKLAEQLDAPTNIGEQISLTDAQFTVIEKFLATEKERKSANKV